MSQRTYPRMALLGTSLADGVLHVDAPGLDTLVLTPEDDVFDVSKIQVWFEYRPAADIGRAAAEWMSEALGTTCRVVRATLPEDGARLSPEGLVRHGFADALPALVISTASLDDLTRRLAERGVDALPMNRFRPGLVVTGTEPYEEDAWTTVRVGDVSVRGVRPCPRCATTMVDQDRGVSAGPEPLRTLAAYRRTERGGPIFGMNVAFDAPGVLRVGDPVVSTEAAS